MSGRGCISMLKTRSSFLNSLCHLADTNQKTYATKRLMIIDLNQIVGSR